MGSVKIQDGEEISQRASSDQQESLPGLPAIYGCVAPSQNPQKRSQRGKSRSVTQVTPGAGAGACSQPTRRAHASTTAGRGAPAPALATPDSVDSDAVPANTHGVERCSSAGLGLPARARLATREAEDRGELAPHLATGAIAITASVSQAGCTTGAYHNALSSRMGKKKFATQKKKCHSRHDLHLTYSNHPPPLLHLRSMTEEPHRNGHPADPVSSRDRTRTWFQMF